MLVFRNLNHRPLKGGNDDPPLPAPPETVNSCQSSRVEFGSERQTGYGTHGNSLFLETEAGRLNEVDRLVSDANFLKDSTVKTD